MSSYTPTTKLSSLKSILLAPLDNPGSTFSASTLWADRPVFIQLVRRPGCQFCREFGARLAEERRLITDKMGVDMVAVVHEELGAQLYGEDFFKGPVYLDSEKDFFKAIGGGKLNWGGILKFFTPTFVTNYRRNKRSSVKGDMKGEGRILGGMYVVGKGDSGIVWEFKELVFGDQPSMLEVVEACAKAAGVTVEEEELRRIKSEEGNSL